MSDDFGEFIWDCTAIALTAVVVGSVVFFGLIWPIGHYSVKLRQIEANASVKISENCANAAQALGEVIFGRKAVEAK